MEVLQVPQAAEFIDELPPLLQARVRRTINLLETHGHALRMPSSRLIARGLYELRILGKVHVRLFYFFHQDRAIILFGVIKKQNRLSMKDIAYAEKVRKDVLATI